MHFSTVRILHLMYSLYFQSLESISFWSEFAIKILEPAEDVAVLVEDKIDWKRFIDPLSEFNEFKPRLKSAKKPVYIKRRF